LKKAYLIIFLLILGARQCGKTTLARTFLKGEYFDLEKPSDLD
jgi:predicted AAA+ superfamily ATPase